MIRNHQRFSSPHRPPPFRVTVHLSFTSPPQTLSAAGVIHILITFLFIILKFKLINIMFNTHVRCYVYTYNPPQIYGKLLKLANFSLTFLQKTTKIQHFSSQFGIFCFKLPFFRINIRCCKQMAFCRYTLFNIQRNPFGEHTNRLISSYCTFYGCKYKWFLRN